MLFPEVDCVHSHEQPRLSYIYLWHKIVARLYKAAQVPCSKAARTEDQGTCFIWVSFPVYATTASLMSLLPMYPEYMTVQWYYHTAAHCLFVALSLAGACCCVTDSNVSVLVCVSNLCRRLLSPTDMVGMATCAPFTPPPLPLPYGCLPSTPKPHLIRPPPLPPLSPPPPPPPPVPHSIPLCTSLLVWAPHHSPNPAPLRMSCHPEEEFYKLWPANTTMCLHAHPLLTPSFLLCPPPPPPPPILTLPPACPAGRLPPPTTCCRTEARTSTEPTS